jgi:flagellar biosynthesis protein FlhB
VSQQARTLPPTARRLRQARRRGDVPRSRDLGAAASWVAVCASLALCLPPALASLRTLATDSFSRLPAQPSPSPAGVLEHALSCLGSLVTPPLVACFAAVLVAGLLFTGPTVSWRSVSPRLDRLDPVAGLRRLVSPERWFTVLRDLAKLALILVLTLACLRAAGRFLASAPSLEPAAGIALVRDLVVQVAAVMGAAAGAFALVDVAWSRFSWMRRLRMTHEELRRELRETEGDPALRGRRRQMHREITEHRMLEDVRRASFVIVNPTHVAVALRWNAGEMDAPTVVAAGRSALARRIIREARRAGVPVMHEPLLARSLADLTPGRTIPEDLYEAVAAIVRALEE